MESVYSAQAAFCHETDGFLSCAAEDEARSCLCLFLKPLRWRKLEVWLKIWWQAETRKVFNTQHSLGKSAFVEISKSITKWFDPRCINERSTLQHEQSQEWQQGEALSEQIADGPFLCHLHWCAIKTWSPTTAAFLLTSPKHLKHHTDTKGKELCTLSADIYSKSAFTLDIMSSLDAPYCTTFGNRRLSEEKHCDRHFTAGLFLQLAVAC